MPLLLLRLLLLLLPLLLPRRGAAGAVSSVPAAELTWGRKGGRRALSFFDLCLSFFFFLLPLSSSTGLRASLAARSASSSLRKRSCASCSTLSIVPSISPFLRCCSLNSSQVGRSGAFSRLSSSCCMNSFEWKGFSVSTRSSPPPPAPPPDLFCGLPGFFPPMVLGVHSSGAACERAERRGERRERDATRKGVISHGTPCVYHCRPSNPAVLPEYFELSVNYGSAETRE